ncbi:MAG: hypothetical protein FDZ75_05015 [Actinobacteria bacterium]|nr:MAG: hypothetical protein FDZ75_05015 [Actinomycetota bacterium]
MLIVLAAVAVWGRVELRLAAVLAGYPAFFALVFALASAPDSLIGAAIVLKAVTAALAAVLVVLSTPYPQVFAQVQRVTPGIVGDALLMTYRATFVLLGKFSNLVRAVRLRAGISRHEPVRAARAGAAAMGGLLLYAIDLSQRDYDVMRLRGYSGRLKVRPMRSRDRSADALLIAGAACALAIAIVWRVDYSALNPYSWIVPPAALVCLGLAALSRRNS